MEKAFEAGYDPALEIASHGKGRKTQSGGPGTEGDDVEEHLPRNEQDRVDRIISGQEKGHYFLLLGPKVTVTHGGSNGSFSQLF